jgi:hypothetical protein
MENPNPTRNPGREPGVGNDDGDVGTDPRRSREQNENDRTRQNPNPTQRPDQTPRTG